MKSSGHIFRNTLRILGTIGLALYVLFLLGEKVPVIKEVTFVDTTVYLLFAFYVLGYYFLWKNELTAGIVFIVWHAIQWCLVLWLWPDGAMTLLFGFPIAFLGIASLVYGIRKKAPVKTQPS